MTHDYAPDGLDIRAFAKAHARLQGEDELSTYERITQDAEAAEAAEAQPEAGRRPLVRWSAHGRTVARAGRADEVWLDLRIQTAVAQTCQRCLRPVQSAVEVERAFRFVDDERTAAELDEASQEDVLVASREFDLHALIEDEILMALPIIPHHEVCPAAIGWRAESEGFEAAEQAPRGNPFAALDVLRKKL